VSDDLRVLGPPSAVETIVYEKQISQVIVVPKALTWESFQQIINCAGGPPNSYELKLSPGLYELLTTGVQVSHQAFVPLFTVNRTRITGVDAWLKTGLNYALGGALLILLAPFMGLIALLLRLGAPGRAIERHPVLGLTQSRFFTLKFRSGPGEGGVLERWLYRSGLDKLPQLFNVLAGQMSLVGPRTISVERKKDYAPWLPNLLTVKPGLTGPWVMLGERNDSLQEEMRLNMSYIRNWTIWLDLQILFQSALRILRGERPRIARSGALAESADEDGSKIPSSAAVRSTESARPLS